MILLASFEGLRSIYGLRAEYRNLELGFYSESWSRQLANCIIDDAFDTHVLVGVQPFYIYKKTTR